jgi:hypothetical protein
MICYRRSRQRRESRALGRQEAECIQRIRDFARANDQVMQKPLMVLEVVSEVPGPTPGKHVIGIVNHRPGRVAPEALIVRQAAHAIGNVGQLSIEVKVKAYCLPSLICLSKGQSCR